LQDQQTTQSFDVKWHITQKVESRIQLVSIICVFDFVVDETNKCSK